MRKLLLLLIILPALFSGCDEDSSPAGPGDGLTFTYLQGKMENWNLGSNKTMSFCVYPGVLNTAKVSSSGTFSLICSKPSGKLLRRITDCFVSPNIIISDSSALFNYAVLNICSGGDELGEAVQSDRKTADMYYLEDTGSFMIEYWYFDRRTDIYGYSISREGKKTVQYNYDIHGLPGWNLVTKSLKQNAVESKTYQMDSGLAAGTHYYYIPYSSLKKRSILAKR